MLKNKLIRTVITQKSHFWFLHFYLCRYITHETAPFQKEMIALTENENIKNLIIVAFRGSAKSTIVTLSYTIWSIIGKQKKKFIVIISQTQRQARQHLANIRQELENNERLRKDLGPFEEQKDEWGSYSLVIPKYGARITAASTEQSIRGLRHGPHRPDLIIADDIEDLASVKTQDGRDKTFKWFVGDVAPAGGPNTKIVVVGNLLHEDSLIMRFKKAIEENCLEGMFKAYPIIDSSGKILWSGKYPTLKDVEIEKRKIGSDIAFQREYMLRIVPEADAVVSRSWIQYYRELPKEDLENPYYIATGIDLAISEKETADYTAIVLARIYGRGNDLRIYIERTINKRMNFPDTKKTIKELFASYNNKGIHVEMFIEDAGYQRALIEALRQECYAVEGVSTMGQDKRSRLTMITPAIKDGTVLFPRKDADHLINQLTGFGVEKHDDLVDAAVMLVSKMIEKNRSVAGSWEGIDIEKWKGTIMGNLRNKEF